MNLFLLRHASAGTRRPNPLLDVRRPLDRDGKQHMLQLAHVLNAQKLTFDLILSSPLKRSLQTAQLIATETGHESRVLLSEALAPAAVFSEFQDLIRQCGARENVLMVGHNPNLQTFLGMLLQPHAVTSPGTPAAPIRLRKGTLARLSFTRGPAVLQSLLDPRTIRALYSTSTRSSRRKISRK